MSALAGLRVLEFQVFIGALLTSLVTTTKLIRKKKIWRKNIDDHNVAKNMHRTQDYKNMSRINYYNYEKESEIKRNTERP